MTDIDNCEKAYLIIHNKDLIEITTLNNQCHSETINAKYIKDLREIIISKKQLDKNYVEKLINENIENYLICNSKEFKDFLNKNKDSYVIIYYVRSNKIRCGRILIGGTIFYYPLREDKF